MSLDLNNQINLSDVEFHLSTQGPLELYRSYSSKISIKKKDDLSWDYFLKGQDRGQPEEKLITYFIDKSPIVTKFIDDVGVSSIPVDPNESVNGRISKGSELT